MKNVWRVLFFKLLQLLIVHGSIILEETLQNLTNHIIEKDSSLRVLLIASFNSGFSHHRIKGFSTRIPVVWFDLQNGRTLNGINLSIPKDSLVVIMSNNAEHNLPCESFTAGYPNNKLNHRSKYIIVTSESNEQNLIRTKNHLIGCKVLNYVFVNFENEKIYSNNAKLELSELKSLNIDLFPDKTLNKVYNILAQFSISMNFEKYSKNKSWYYYLLTALAEIQNSTLNFAVLKNKCKDKNQVQKLYKNLRQLEHYDLDLIDVPLSESKPRLMIYQEEAFCAMVPMGKYFSTIETALSEHSLPGSVWLIWLLSISVGALCWKLLRKSGSDSQWRFISAILSVMVGQMISLRSNQKILLIMLQIFIFSTFYLKNIYEGVVTSTTLEKFENTKFYTLNEIFESKIDYKYIVAPQIHNWMKNLSNYEDLRKQISTVPIYDPFPKLASERYVFIENCDRINHKMNMKRKDAPSDFFYLLPQKLLVHLRSLDVGLASPYLEKWQIIVNRMFEAGLLKLWQTSTGALDINRRYQLKYADNNPEFIGLSELMPTFVRASILFLISFVVFILEIFYFDFLSKITWSLIKRKRKRKTVKLKVRKIKVRPMAANVSKRQRNETFTKAN